MNMNPNFGHAVPLVGQQVGPMGMQTLTYITPQFKERLDTWTEKYGILPEDLGLMIMRLGLVALSQYIDSPDNQIKDPNYFLPDALPNEKEND